MPPDRILAVVSTRDGLQLRLRGRGPPPRRDSRRPWPFLGTFTVSELVRRRDDRVRAIGTTMLAVKRTGKRRTGNPFAPFQNTANKKQGQCAKL